MAASGTGAYESGGNLDTIATLSTTISGLSAGALNALLVPPTNISQYAWWSLSIVGNAHVGQLSWQGSDDNFASAAVGMYAYQQNVPSAYFQNATNIGNNVQIFHGPRTSSYFQVIMNAYTSGSVTGTLCLYKMPSFAGSINAIQTGTWGVNINLSGTAVKDDTQSGDGVTSGILAGTTRLWNGASYDRMRGNIDTYSLLTSGAVSANGNSVDQINYNARGVKIFINTGSFGSGASAITVSLQGKDPVSGQYYAILTSASLTASTFSVLSVYPGLTASANVISNDVLPRTFRISYSASNWGTGGSTLGIACAMIV